MKGTFKRVLSVVLMLALVIVSFSTQSFVSAKTATNVDIPTTKCPSCQKPDGSKEIPKSSGNIQDQKKAISTVFKSKQFKKTSKEIKNFKRKDIIVNVITDDGQAVVGIPVNRDSNGLTLVSYMVNFKTNEIGLEQKFYVQDAENDKVNFKWVANDSEVINVLITKDGKMIDSNGKEYSADEYLKIKKNEIEKNLVPSSKSLCTWAVGLMCAAAGIIDCYYVCIDKALTDFLGGLGCSLVCGLIWEVGCVIAVSKVC
ncbi:putative immunity/bacteriocin fusion bifunctional protein [Bacillus paramobilis]|uniref:putative immunity/bacteriocin fusion bifunctional protein n=1 Tax=Bacillus paramobilis TaxID=2817477 RepID=UPI003D1B9B93